MFSVDSPSGASALTVNGTLKLALPEYVSVLIPKFGSFFTTGFVPVILPSANGPSASVMRVGIGPPAPCVIEYIFQPPPMLAEIFAVPLPPAGTLAGETLIESDTGVCCAAAANEHTATVQNVKNKIESLDLKIRIIRYTGSTIAQSLSLYARAVTCNALFIRHRARKSC